MLCGRIAFRPLDRTKRSLARHAALQLPLHFASRALFQRISAADHGEARNDERN
jgi:hypothetical protein